MKGEPSIYGNNYKISLPVTKQYPVIRKDCLYIDTGLNKNVFENQDLHWNKTRSIEQFQLLQNNLMWKCNSCFLCLIFPLPVSRYLSKI